MNFRKKIGIFLLAAWLGAALSWAVERESRALGEAQEPRIGRAFGAPIRIAGEPSTTYNEKTIVKFHPSGALYILFKATNDETKKHYVDLYRYDGVRSTLVKHVSETNLRAYEPDMAITSDGTIHCVWIEGANPNADTQYIRYRSFDGANWSPVQTLRTLTITGIVTGHNLEKVDDVRLAVDDDHNIFVAYMIWPAARCQTFSIIDGVTYFDPFPQAGRSKHLSVDIDDQYVHLTWVGLDGIYAIFYARRTKAPNTSWNPVIKVLQPQAAPPDRPFIQVNHDAVPQLVYLKGLSTGGRELHHRSWKGAKFSDPYIVSGPVVATFHPPEISAWDDDNMLVFVQTWAGGVRNYYNWFRDGQWGGFTLHNQLKVVESYGNCALNGSGVGAIAYAAGGSIQLLTSGPLSVNDLPTAVINVDKESLYWGETIAMNANGSSDSDGTIVRYEWKIVQDNETLEGPSVTYTFKKNYNNVKVRLTAIDDKGGRGVAEKVIKVNALYTAPSTAKKKMIQTLIYNKEGYVVEWTPNPKNDEAGYAIVKYRVSRRAVGGSEWLELGEVDASRRAYADVTVEAGVDYVYAVSAVDDQGRMSPYDNY